MSPRWRLAGVGTLILTLFGTLILRLWYLQVGSLDTALGAAEAQQLLEVAVEAPRGDILDRNGIEMAGTRAALGLLVDLRLMPEGRVDTLTHNLAALLDVPPSEVEEFFADHKEESRFRFRSDVSEATAMFVLEHNEDFPGLVVAATPVRSYPLGDSAAHVIGYVGSAGEEDLRRSGISAEDRVGRFGIEGSYDSLLRGTPGRTVYRVNAHGQIIGIIEEVSPQPGGSVVSTIDLDLQRRLEIALSEGMNLARLEGADPVRATGVVLDPRDGSVLAMASLPAFEPELFADGLITADEWDSLSEKATLNNFAIQGLYPPASTFKVVGYTLALERSPLLYPDLSVYPDPELAQERYGALEDATDPSWFFADGAFDFPNTPLLEDWRIHGEVNIHSSLQASSDQYYWGIALKIWRSRGEEWEEDLLQEWARALGFGEPTGIDLPFEQAGIVPDREWFQNHQSAGTGVVRAEGGWSAGDLMNIAIGQGSLAVTPLQLANAYAALVNGGILWRPRIVQSVEDRAGNTIFVNMPSVSRTIDISPTTVLSLKNDLNGVVAGDRGTATVAFATFCGAEVPAGECESLRNVGGKTGTAEIKVAADEEDEIDTAWFVGVAPLDNPRYVVAVVIDEGGSGGKIAAPTARAVLQFLMDEPVTPITSGGDDTE